MQQFQSSTNTGLQISNDTNFYPIHISSPEYKKLLAIMTQPEYKIWYKDEEVTQEELIEILSK